MTDCLICKKHKDKSAESRLVFSDDNWLIYHSHETNILGYFFLESRRHFLDLSEATAEEAVGYGVLLKRLMSAMHQVIDCERIYTFSLGQTVPHLHVHVIPCRADMPRAYKGRGITSYPATPVADPALVEEVCSRVRRALVAQTAGLPHSGHLAVKL